MQMQMAFFAVCLVHVHDPTCCLVLCVLSCTLMSILIISHVLSLRCVLECLVSLQVLRSIAFLHSLNLIHSDLKPENILVKSYSRYAVHALRSNHNSHCSKEALLVQ